LSLKRCLLGNIIWVLSRAFLRLSAVLLVLLDQYKGYALSPILYTYCISWGS